MKKLKSITVIGLLSLFVILSLTACGNEGKTTGSSASSVPEQTVNKETNNQMGITFENDVLTSANAVIKLTGSEIGVNDSGKPILMIFFDFTNKKESETYRVAYAFQDYFSGTQNTGAVTERLALSSPPDSKYEDLDSMFAKDVNPGATVKSVCTYELVDPSVPVDLIITNPYEEEITRKTYEVKF